MRGRLDLAISGSTPPILLEFSARDLALVAPLETAADRRDQPPSQCGIPSSHMVTKNDELLTQNDPLRDQSGDRIRHRSSGQEIDACETRVRKQEQLAYAPATAER